MSWADSALVDVAQAKTILQAANQRSSGSVATHKITSLRKRKPGVKRKPQNPKDT